MGYFFLQHDHFKNIIRLSLFETCVAHLKAARMSECQPKYLRALDCIDASVIGVQYL